MVLIKAALRRRAGASAPPRVHTRGLRVHEDAGPPSRPEDRRCQYQGSPVSSRSVRRYDGFRSVQTGMSLTDIPGISPVLKGKRIAWHALEKG